MGIGSRLKGYKDGGRPYSWPVAPHWLDEIDLDPDVGWLSMGTRALGGRPWLIVDDRWAAELALKARLLAERHDEVFGARREARPQGGRPST